MITNDERLALLVAIDKTLAPELKDAKTQAQVQLVELAEQGLADRKPVLVGGEKVGEVGVSYTTAKPVILPDYESERQALEFLAEHDLVTMQPVKGWEQDFVQAGDKVIYQPTGEVAPGMQWEGQKPKCATVRIKDTQAVFNAFGNRLAGQDVGTLLFSPDSLLLEGGKDGK